jgi:hypothetical protein
MKTAKQMLVDPAKCSHAKSYLKSFWKQSWGSGAPGDTENRSWLQTDCKKCGTVVNIEHDSTFYDKSHGHGH